MKTVIIAFLAIFIFGVGNAQITVTTADMPVAGESYTLSTALPGGSVLDTVGGAGKTWDFSGLSATAQSEDTFFSKSSMPPAYQLYFLTSNLGEKAADFSFGAFSLTNSYNIYKNSNAGFEQTAAAGELNGVAIPVYYTPADVWYEFPLHYGDTSTSNSAYAVSLPTIGSVSQQRVRKNKVLGWGNLKLPMGTFDVLLVRAVLFDQDSIYIDFLGAGTRNDLTTYEYKFIGQKKGMPLLEIDVAGVLGQRQVTSVTYQDTLALVSGIPLNEPQVTFSSFPNPSANVVKVVTNYGRELKIADITGRTVFARQLNNRETEIDVAPFPNGIYFISVSDNSGMLLTKKLVVQH